MTSRIDKLIEVERDAALALRVKRAERARAGLQEEAHADVLVEREHAVVGGVAAQLQQAGSRVPAGRVRLEGWTSGVRIHDRLDTCTHTHT